MFAWAWRMGPRVRVCEIHIVYVCMNFADGHEERGHRPVPRQVGTSSH